MDETLDTIIASTGGSGETDPVGIPVGNLTSQWIANLVGNRIDQWAKRTMGLQRYARYMDDMVVLVRSKQEALELRAAFDDKLASMGLRFSKASVLPASRGVNFLGYRIWPHKRLLRKDSVRRMKRAMRAMQRDYAEGKISLAQVQERINSWVAHVSHANSENLRRQILGSVVFSRGGKEAVR